ncbi:iron ABC transporter [Bradymonas sediminis]|uniref:Iron ABC transporter n=2 Tax=Bradymonas sediminis TaxID=1548548 RepID=A0A2Z4FQ79_9DELT|nr:iron ABC transporter [Bradymonas sediminis]
MLLLGGMLLGAILLGCGQGATAVAPSEILQVLAAKLGLQASPGRPLEAIVWSIRLPRVLLAALVGASLALAGASLQGLFRNPLADPGLIGISSGAASGAALALVAGWVLQPVLSWVPAWLLVPLAAFAGGVLATFVVYRIATFNGRTSVATMLLAGIAINALGGALIGFLTFAADEAALRSLSMWMLGSLGGAGWTQVLVCAGGLLVGSCFLLRRTGEIDALMLGAREAQDLGVDVQRLERRIVLLSAFMVGLAVAFTGLIGFIGLVAPHMIRLWRGPSHRVVLPGAMLLGALLLVLADVFSRTLLAPAELPIGIVTALVGAPFFLFLLMQRREGGWS